MRHRAPPPKGRSDKSPKADRSSETRKTGLRLRIGKNLYFDDNRVCSENFRSTVTFAVKQSCHPQFFSHLKFPTVYEKNFIDLWGPFPSFKLFWNGVCIYRFDISTNRGAGIFGTQNAAFYYNKTKGGLGQSEKDNTCREKSYVLAGKSNFS